MALTPPGPDLSRFVDAYRDDFERAFGEIEGGRKRSHWMWYIFPQVTGLGGSEMSRRYAIVSVQEAEAFLAHPMLGDEYRRIVDAVWHQVVERGVRIRVLFGSPDDAKLVSSLTLFVAVAQRLDSPQPAHTTFVTHADDVLRTADAQGLPRCTTTERFVAGALPKHRRATPLPSGRAAYGTGVAQTVEERVRAICTSLPEVTEKLSHGAPAFFVKKQFVMLWAHGHHDHQFPHLWCAAPPGAQGELVETEPERFFRPPYVGGRGWLGVRLDRDVDWSEIAAVCKDAYRAVAPSKLAAAVDAD